MKEIAGKKEVGLGSSPTFERKKRGGGGEGVGRRESHLIRKRSL